MAKNTFSRLAKMDKSDKSRRIFDQNLIAEGSRSFTEITPHSTYENSISMRRKTSRGSNKAFN